MAWHESTVPGRGWIELRNATQRVTTEYVKLVAEVRVNTEDPVWKFYTGQNFRAIQKAIMGRLRTVNVVRGQVLRKDRALREMARERLQPFTEAELAAGAIHSPEERRQAWLDFWSDVLDVTVLDVARWDATRPGNRRVGRRKR